MDRHGAESHYLRPDGVYITSVLQPTVNYDPVADAQAVGANFVAYGGLAGPKATAHRRLGDPSTVLPTSLTGWWANFKARIQSNFTTNTMAASMGIHPAAVAAAAAAAAATPVPATAPVPATGGAVTVDASPRPPNSDPTAIATSGGWAPAGQTTSSAAALIATTQAGDPPANGVVATGVAMDPAGAGAPLTFWQSIMQSGLPPVVAARSAEASLKRWFGIKG